MGKTKNHMIVQETITMSTVEQDGKETVVPNYGDIQGFMFQITASATGTLTTASDLCNAIAKVNIVDKAGNDLTQNIRGQDLPLLERYRLKGRNRTLTDVSGSAQTQSFFLPLNIETERQDVKIKVTCATYGAMAASGATGGSLTYKVFAVYEDPSPSLVTEKIQRIQVPLVQGDNTLTYLLPQGKQVNGVLWTATEAYIDTIKFSGDGQKELDNCNAAFFAQEDEMALVDGHVSGQFSLYMSAFLSSPKVVWDYKTTTADTAQVFLITQA